MEIRTIGIDRMRRHAGAIRKINCLFFEPVRIPSRTKH
jgi:hypothetical protein